jgi:hypothetical protein
MIWQHEKNRLTVIGVVNPARSSGLNGLKMRLRQLQVMAVTITCVPSVNYSYRNIHE